MIDRKNVVKEKYGDNHWWELKDNLILGAYQWFEPILLTNGGVPRASSEIWDEIMSKCTTTKEDPLAIKKKRKCICYGQCSGKCNIDEVYYEKYPLAQLAEAPEKAPDELIDRDSITSAFSGIGTKIQYGILLLEKALETKPIETLSFLKGVYENMMPGNELAKETLLFHIKKIKGYWHAGILQNHFGIHLGELEKLINK